MRITRGIAFFLFGFGIWSWIIWITFAKNLWASDQSWAADGSPTGYFVVHAVLTVVSFVLGTAIGVLGWRGVRANAKERSGSSAP
ncbi:SCO4848 family membrane protein [Amycolatopsis jejuensis]|uniref:SCO4848 family membrane protein n=1 Tax=Amycolatopsis jejuensis TaxID=330084 RepID=UPI000524DB63|nr:membrane protein [Amycolatopsis jejuensis]